MFRDVPATRSCVRCRPSCASTRPRQHARSVDRVDPRALYSAFGERQVSTIYLPTDSYQVIMEVAPESRQDERAFNNVYVRSSSGSLVPLSSFATVERTVGATSVNHVGQLQAVTVTFNLAPGAALGDATKKIAEARGSDRMPASIISSWGRRRGGVPDSQAAMILIVAALLSLRALGLLYESYIHPLTILAGLPSAAVGATGQR